jgi:hypothetical protein
MANLGGFNPADFNTEDNFDPVPAGVYVASITESVMKDTRENNGKYLKLTWKILEGPYANRLVWENINLVNKNPEAVEIAKNTLAKVCKACGINRPVNDSSELHGIPCKVKVSIRPAKDGYDASNDVKGHKLLESNVPAVATAPAQVPTQSTAPWMSTEDAIASDSIKPRF